MAGGNVTEREHLKASFREGFRAACLYQAEQRRELGLSQAEFAKLLNVASGGNFWPVGHIVDHHQYPHPSFPFELGENGRFDGYVKIVGEFGGHGLVEQGHVWDAGRRNWGYSLATSALGSS